MKMKIIIGLLLALQALLLWIGLWQIQQESQITVAAGWFNIILNILFGALNVINFIRA